MTSYSQSDGLDLLGTLSPEFAASEVQLVADGLQAQVDAIPAAART
jgi:hypothetical protein